MLKVTCETLVFREAYRITFIRQGNPDILIYQEVVKPGYYLQPVHAIVLALDACSEVEDIPEFTPSKELEGS
jgi:hypothetical protein